LDGLVAVAAKRPAPLAAQKGVTILAAGASNPERKDIHPENGLVRFNANCRFSSFFRRGSLCRSAESGRDRAVI
jgi:hypothetical protein